MLYFVQSPVDKGCAIRKKGNMTDSEKLDLLLAEMQGMKTDMQEMKADIRELKADVKELKADIEQLKAEVKELRADVEQLKADVKQLKADVEQLKADVEDLKIRVERMESDLLILKRKVDDIEIHIENSTDRNIRILAENFIDLMTKLNQAIPAADKNQLYEIRVDYLIIEVEKLKKNVKMLMEKTA